MHNALTMLIFSRALRSAALAALIFPVISVSAHARFLERLFFRNLTQEKIAGLPESMRALIEEGASPNIAISAGGSNLLHSTITLNAPEIARILLDAGVRGWDTPEERFHCRSAATVPSDAAVEILKMMLDHGSPIDAKDKNGKTLLDYAAEFGNAKAVRVLLERGADASALSLQPRNAASKAARRFERFFANSKTGVPPAARPSLLIDAFIGQWTAHHHSTKRPSRLRARIV